MHVILLSLNCQTELSALCVLGREAVWHSCCVEKVDLFQLLSKYFNMDLNHPGSSKMSLFGTS